MYGPKTFNTKQTAVEVEETKSWPPKVTYRNAKTGLVDRQEPYIFRTVGSLEKGSRDRRNYVEFPAGSGNLWDSKWNAVGRWDKDAPEGKRFKEGEAHVVWTAPETEDQKLAKEMAQKSVRIAELEKELAAIQAEREVKKPEIKTAAKKEAGV